MLGLRGGGGGVCFGIWKGFRSRLAGSGGIRSESVGIRTRRIKIDKGKFEKCVIRTVHRRRIGFCLGLVFFRMSSFLLIVIVKVRKFKGVVDCLLFSELSRRCT